MIHPKPKTLRNRKYLDWLCTQRCIITNCIPTEPHHIKLFGGGGMGIKPPDTDAIPVLHHVHHNIHQHGEYSIFYYYWGTGREETRLRLQGVCDRLWKRFKNEN